MTRAELIQALVEAIKHEHLQSYKKAAKREVRAGKITQGAGVGMAIAGAIARAEGHKKAGVAGMVAGGVTALAGGSRKKYGNARHILHKHLSGEKTTRQERVRLRMANPSKSLVHRELHPKHHKHALKAYASDREMLR